MKVRNGGNKLVSHKGKCGLLYNFGKSFTLYRLETS